MSFKDREDATEESVPFEDNGYEYGWHYHKEAEYRCHSRKNLITGERSIFLDESELAKGEDYFVVGSWSVSPDNTLLAYSVDVSGDERYQIHIKDFTTGELLEDVLTDTQGDLEFSSDGPKAGLCVVRKRPLACQNTLRHTDLETPQFTRSNPAL